MPDFARKTRRYMLSSKLIKDVKFWKSPLDQLKSPQIVLTAFLTKRYYFACCGGSLILQGRLNQRTPNAMSRTDGIPSR